MKFNQFRYFEMSPQNHKQNILFSIFRIQIKNIYVKYTIVIITFSPK